MKTLKPLLLIAICCALGAAAANAGTLENLERERAIVLDTYLDQALQLAERQSKTRVSRSRLIDLERMVLRDKSLSGKNTPRVRKAFDNYDLTFLVHASTESNRGVLDHWLEQIGISTHSLMNTRLGRR